MKRTFTITLSFIFILSLLLTACGKNDNGVVKLPVAPANPNITHPAGEFYEVDGELRAQGGLSVLGEDFLKIMIDGKAIEFKLSQNARKQIEYYNKDKKKPQIMIGTMLLIDYENKDLIKIAESIEIVTAN